MQVTMLPAFFCTGLIVCLWPLFRKWLSPQYVLLFFSLAYFAFISLPGALVLFFLAAVVYAGGYILDRTKGIHVYQVVIVTTCLLPLILYKIIDSPSFDFLFVHHYTLLEVVGISYFTFNGLSYLFDIRKGYLLPEKNFGHLLLYLSFFPCIPAGPLHRYKYLQAQFSAALNITEEDLSRGFRLVLWGLFKNLVLAQRLKTIADLMLDHPASYQGIFVWLGGLFFFFQLYCDFSGYVDVAMGFARMMGVQLSSNFSNRVYASPSRTDFWKGWHQTLNHWFRDYVFFPLVKGRSNEGRINVVMLFTFMLIGLWHALSLRFLVWGLLNGLWVLAETKVRKRLPVLSSRLWGIAGVVYHLSIASCMAVIFRTNEVQVSLKALFADSKQQFSEDAIVRQFVFIVPLFLGMDLMNRAMKNDTVDVYLGRQSRWHRWLFYFIIALLIMSFGRLPGDNHYYMRF